MFGYLGYGASQFVPIGVLVMYSFLLIYSLWTAVRRLSKNMNRTIFFILTAAVFGVINGALFLYLILSVREDYTGNIAAFYRGITPAQWFGLAIIPMTWLSGFSFLSTIIGSSILVKLAYLLTLILIILTIVTFAAANSIIERVTQLLAWLYFILYSALMIRHRHQLTRLENTVLIAFGILNTIRLIVETIDMFTLYLGLPNTAYGFVMFFFTDFLSAISMILIVKFYNKLTPKDDMYDN